MNKEKNRTPVLVDMLSLKIPTTEDYQKAFDKLTWQQKGNAIRFGSLSDQHIVELRDMIRQKRYLKRVRKDKVLSRLFHDLMCCALYTGCKPLGNGDLNEKTYNQWLKNRVSYKRDVLK